MKLEMKVDGKFITIRKILGELVVDITNIKQRNNCLAKSKAHELAIMFGFGQVATDTWEKENED